VLRFERNDVDSEALEIRRLVDVDEPASLEELFEARLKHSPPTFAIGGAFKPVKPAR
jgi:hypothetical protein